MRKFNLILIIVFLGLMSFVGAQTGSYGQSVTYQPRASFQAVYGPEDRLNTYWPILGDKDSCLARQDLLLQVSPIGCQPAVVRSDLLAEQNVPVFCQIDALQINPLIDIRNIRGIRFTGKYPNEVIGAGFHPAQAALRTRDKLLGSPLINNIGYIVVVLKKNPVEKNLPEFIKVNLTAQLDYEADNVFGVGKAEFLLEPVGDNEWEGEKFKQSFWNGRYYVRLEQADPNFAVVSIYTGDKGLLGGRGKIATTKVERGKTSESIWVPGAYCRAGLQIAYDGFVGAENKATISLSDDKGTDIIDVYQGSRFLNDRCTIDKINVGKNSTNSTIYTGQNSTNSAINTGSVTIRCSDSQKINLRLEDVNNISQERSLGDKDKDFDDTINSLKKVVDEYPSEKERNVDGASLWGELALQRAIKLAEDAGKEKTRAELIREFIETYPDSFATQSYRYELSKSGKIDFSSAGGVINIDNRFYNVRLIGIEKPKKDSNIEIAVTGAQTEAINVGLQELRNFSDSGVGTIDSIRLDKVDNEENVKVTVNCRGEKSAGGSYSIKSNSFNLKINEDTKVCDKTYIRLRDVELKQTAKIRLIPQSQGTRAETNLTVNIGIEKRAIKLSPDKTEELISNLNDSIKKWDNINDRLGKVVTGLKGACFATAGILTVKNFLTGIGGEALARQKVMTGWTRTCADLVSAGKYPTINACYLDKSSEIDKDVSNAEDAINGINSRIDNIEKNYVEEEGTFGTSYVDRSKAAVSYCNDLKSRYGTRDVAVKGQNMKFADVLGDCEEGYNKQGLYGYNELREMEYNIIMQDKGSSTGIKTDADKLLQGSYDQILNNKDRYSEIQRAQQAKSLGLPAPIVATSSVRKNVVGEVVGTSGIQEVNLKELIPVADTHVASVNVYNTEKTDKNGIVKGFKGGENYYFGLVKDSEGYYAVQDVFKKTTTGYETLNDDRKAEFLDVYGIGRITPAESVSYINSYKNPEVRYYETEPYKGMPAIVPFDTREGWYAATRQTLPVFGGIGAFDSSGKVTSFYLCNVGPNGQEQFYEGYGDDICQLINLNTGQPLGFFPGLTEADAKRRVGQAVNAISEAANQYGKKIARVNGKDFGVGRPAANIPSTQCQNFMSPEECHLLFNVCDPVICPSSRCDFGGQFPVADVVQTGIIGSTLLCLPNVREKIAIPVCLTGIHAGIDGYLSILKNHRDCLQESLATGNSVGICDQIYSIYLCEFFWKQIAPVAKVILPKIIESAYGQGTRGGGEYLTTMAAWQNTENSINYFTQTYAVNSLTAFRARSIDEVGTQFCKGFVSAKAPTSFKTLIEPDSPPQFHAWFSTTKFTDATVPATSQYKVFYHIFAGKDQGVYFSVYLKNPPESGFFTLPSVINVASGFAGRGQYASESKDFTAPEGYKELCVRVNDKEECGFKEVSTSFALDYLKDSYVSGQAGQSEIKSESECVSGSANLAPAALSGNIQAGAEEALIPSVYNRGLVRICSSRNPGSETDPTRFADMGYCDDQKIRCWLDKTSVKNAITDNNKGLLNSTLSSIEARQKADLVQKGIIVGDDAAVAEIKEITDSINKLRAQTSISGQETQESVNRLNALLGRVVLNHQKANILYLIGDVKAIGVEKAIVDIKVDEAISNAAQEIVGDVRPEETSAEESNSNIINPGIQSIQLTVNNTPVTKVNSKDTVVVNIKENCDDVQYNIKSKDSFLGVDLFAPDKEVGKITPNSQGLLKLPTLNEGKYLIEGTCYLDGKVIDVERSGILEIDNSQPQKTNLALKDKIISVMINDFAEDADLSIAQAKKAKIKIEHSCGTLRCIIREDYGELKRTIYDETIEYNGNINSLTLSQISDIHDGKVGKYIIGVTCVKDGSPIGNPVLRNLTIK
ncbi:MAG: hypothetical protein AABX83_04170 [Nanoarchaeota archaeon]